MEIGIIDSAIILILVLTSSKTFVHFFHEICSLKSKCFGTFCKCFKSGSSLFCFCFVLFCFLNVLYHSALETKVLNINVKFQSVA